MDKKYELAVKYATLFEELLGDIITEEKTIDAVVELIQDCIDEAAEMDRYRYYPYEIAERLAKVDIDGESPPDGISTHYYWQMLAGFANKAEAESYLLSYRNNEGGSMYGLFINGIPVDFE